MNADEWNQLKEMHEQINEMGISTFNTPFLEKYSELFAKSLEGKGVSMEKHKTPVS